MCEFQAVVLSEGIAKNELDSIVIDGFYVGCAEVIQINS